MVNTSSSRQSVLVAGATGYTGRRLIPLLDRHNVIGWLRADSPDFGAKSRWLEANGVRVVSDSLAELPNLKSRLDSVKTVVSLLGTTRAQFDAKTSYESVDFALNQSLLRIAKEIGAKRFILLSSIGTAKPVGPYLTIKRKTEDLVINSGLDYVILRPSFITGPGRRAPELLSPFFKLVGLACPKWANTYRGLSADTLASIIQRVIEIPELHNTILEGTDLWQLAG